MLRALLFDLDGTLTNTDPVHRQAWQEELQRYGFTVDEDFYRGNISGKLNPDIIRSLLPHWSAAEAKVLADRKEARFRELAPGLTATSGFARLHTWAAQQSLTQALVTNAPRDNVFHMRKALKLEQAFASIVLGEELERGKPDPLPYQVALQRVNVTATTALAFEDSQAGIRSAVGAGIPTIGVTTTHTPEELQAAGAIATITDFNDPQLWVLLSAYLPSLVGMV